MNNNKILFLIFLILGIVCLTGYSFFYFKLDKSEVENKIVLILGYTLFIIFFYLSKWFYNKSKL